MIDLVLFDIDNTTIPLGAKVAPRRVVNSVHLAHASGLHIGPGTGRTPFEVAQLYDHDEHCYATGIMANGKIIKVDGRIVEKHVVDIELARRVSEVVSQFEGCFTCAYPLDNRDRNNSYVVGTRDQEVLAHYIKKVSFHPIPVDDFPELEILNLTIGVPGDQDLLDRVITAVDAEVDEIDPVSPFDGWIDANLHGVNKASGFRSLIDYMGLAPEQTLFCGDGGNDLQIMAETPNAVAVANAVSEVRDAARYHVGSCEDFGVAVALDQLVAAQAKGALPAFMAGV